MRSPEGHGSIARAIRTLKEPLLWIRSFATIEELRCALTEWAQSCDERWLVERHQHNSPAQVRREYYAAQTGVDGRARRTELHAFTCPRTP